MRQKYVNQFLFFLLAAAILFFLFIVLNTSFFLFLISFFCAYLVFPLVEKLESMGVPRIISSIGMLLLVSGIFTVILVFIIPFIVKEFQAFLMEGVPSIIGFIEDKLFILLTYLGIETGPEIRIGDIFVENIYPLFSQVKPENLLKIANTVGTFLLNSANIVGIILSLIIIPVFFVHILFSFEKFEDKIIEWGPRSLKDKLPVFFHRCNEVLSGYLRGQLTVALFLMFWYGIGFKIIGLKYGFLLGIASGLLSFIPYVGAAVSIIGSAVLLLIDFKLMLCLGVVMVISSAQILESFVLSPKIVGNKVGLTPLQAMFSFIFFANLLGFWGVLLALPLGGILKIILVEFHKVYKNSKYSF